MGLGNTPALWNIHSLVIAGGTQEVWGPRAHPIVMATMATIVEFDEFNKKKSFGQAWGRRAVVGARPVLRRGLWPLGCLRAKSAKRRSMRRRAGIRGAPAISAFASAKREAPKRRRARARRYLRAHMRGAKLRIRRRETPPMAAGPACRISFPRGVVVRCVVTV